MVTDEVARLARAVEANWCTAWASLGGVPGQLHTFVDDTPDFLRVCTPGVPEMLVNTVLRYAGPAPVAQADLERVIAPYRRYRLPFQWWMTLGDEPRGLREQLHRLQLLSCGGAACMALRLAGWAPPSHVGTPDAGESLGRITGQDDGRDALHIICGVFYVPAGPMARWTTENPAFQLYLTRLGGHPVCALATLRDGATVGVYHVATRPGYRRRGLAGRLLSVALYEAQQAGAELATLTATPEAHLLYESLGFRACGHIEQWIPGPALMGRLGEGDGPAQARRGGRR
jgi:GNAT superfamily N-acetyltransferase